MGVRENKSYSHHLIIFKIWALSPIRLFASAHDKYINHYYYYYFSSVKYDWAAKRTFLRFHHHHQLTLNRECPWGTTDEFTTSFSSISPVLHCPLGLGELQACALLDVVFPPLPLSALSSSPFHCALQNGFGQTWWTGDMTMPLQFASLYHGQEVFVWSIARWILARTSSLVTTWSLYEMRSILR